MTQFLPVPLITLFAARDPIPFLPPVGKLSHEKHTIGYHGVGQYVSEFEDPKDTPPPGKYETKDERRERKRREKIEQVAYRIEQAIALWNPNEIQGTTLDPFKTVFVGRINYDTSESKLRREFETYGQIRQISIIHDKKTGKPRGYAFVEYEHERDMHSAFKNADGRKIDGKRILVDVERGRTVTGWLPRRLGGGLGGTRRGGPDMNVKISGREDPDRERFRDDRRNGSRDRISRDRGSRDRVSRRERDRSKDRDFDRRDRRDKDRVRRRSRDKVSRERDRVSRGDRDKDRERRRKRSRSKDRRDKGKDDPEEYEESSRSRKRSKSKDRKRRRSRSRDKDRKRDKKDREKSNKWDREPKDSADVRIKTEKDPDADSGVRVKEEPIDHDGDEDEYNNSYYNDPDYDVTYPIKHEPQDHPSVY